MPRGDNPFAGLSDEELNDEMDSAFKKENMSTGDGSMKIPAVKERPHSPEVVEKAKTETLANNAALEIIAALKEGRSKDLAGFKERFLADVPKGQEDKAMAALHTALDAHRAILGAFKKEGEPEDALSAEIDSFSRSLESSTEARTAGGKEYLKKLESGGFDSLEEAVNALDGLAKGAKTEEEQAAMNAEFNVLFAAIQEKFSGAGATSETGTLGNITDGEIDDLDFFGDPEQK